MDFATLIGDIDAATFAVGAGVFVLVELFKLGAPFVGETERGQRFLRILPLTIGILSGVLLLRESPDSVLADSIVSGLRRGLAAGAIAMGGWELWRLTVRAWWRRLFGDKSGPPAPIIHLDPKKPRKRKRAD